MSTLQNFPLLRSAIERLSKNKRIKRRLPNGRHIYVSPDSQLKYLLHDFDSDLVDLANRFVNATSTVWDIGANCGIFAFSCSEAQQVIAVEADPFLLNLLQESNRINGRVVNIVSAAVADTQGFAGFSIANRGRASNHLSTYEGNSQTGGERSRLFVQTTTLDSLLDHFAPPTLVKIDVEGAELAVLKGAYKLLHTIRPVIYLETNGITHSECQILLESAGYEMLFEKEMNWLCTYKSD